MSWGHQETSVPQSMTPLSTHSAFTPPGAWTEGECLLSRPVRRHLGVRALTGARWRHLRAAALLPLWERTRVSETLRVYENKDTVGKERWAVPRGAAVLGWLSPGWLSPDLRPHPRLAEWQRGEEQRATAFVSLLGQACSPATCRVWLPWPRRG